MYKGIEGYASDSFHTELAEWSRNGWFVVRWTSWVVPRSDSVGIMLMDRRYSALIEKEVEENNNG